ncbi:MAG: LysM peptidoglycan-binding domain-containing protein [Dermatophilaceae bacterium]
MSLVVGITSATSPLPSQAAPTLLQRSANPAPYGWTVLTVRSGDTLSDIAIMHRTTVGVLLTVNRIHDGGNFLAIGRRLQVPRTKPAPTKPAPTRAAAAVRTATYVVRSGDTLSGIAASYKVSLATLYSLNKISRTAYIQPGQRISVPAPAATAKAKATASPAVTTVIITVRSGDTLSDIAVRQGVTTASLLKANGLSLRSILQIGQMLKVVTPKKADSSNTFAGRTYPDKVVSAAAANRAYLARHNAPSRTQTKAMIVATARRHGVDPKLALAVSWQESGWNQRQVSVANAIGAMQVIPSSGAWASELIGRRLNLLNAQDNITAGVIILRSLTRSASTQTHAIAGYYQGLYSVQNSGMYADTKQYVASVLSLTLRM